ncbi:ABC transporter permease [Pontibacter sp. SGAir0037]|uniref:ABC transporter permease n=1 Tax=Pontibacter sp. SGAir0037 TaxID=2571030 RepID=UPI0010CCC6B5|nr:ABC transporter permease [Pontibacter sp. SGAir0037]QCR22438.1 hypothetical protein C1N53_08875 [Pontibacter sp. SGAir0037]
MLKNYFLTAFRSLLRNKSYSLLNITGLALGITCSILLFLVVKYQLSFDTFHSKADRVYRIVVNFEGSDYKNPGAHFPLTDLIRSNQNLGFEAITQIEGSGSVQINIVDDNNKTIKKLIEDNSIGYAEPSIFEVLDFGMAAQGLGAYLEEPNAVILTASIAEKYFPGENPVGKLIRLNNRHTLKVAATMPDIPANTEFPFVMLISYKTIEKEQPTDWGNLSSSHQALLILPKGMAAATAEENLNNFLQRFSTEERTRRTQVYKLQPLSDIHYNPAYHGGFAQTAIAKEVLYGMALAGLILLLTACINFINLATAQALKRAKEVGVRKVLGGNQQQLILQFLCETFLVVLFATLLSVILAELALPFLNEVMQLSISFNLLQDQVLLLFLVLQTVVVTLFAGFYPAFVISSFQPITALKSRINLQHIGGISLRQVLVVLQFTICQVLIICTILVNDQMEFFKNKALGFDKEAVVSVYLPQGKSIKTSFLREQLLQNPAIRGVSFASDVPSSSNVSSSNIYFDNATQDEDFQSHQKFVDAQYFDLFDLKFIAGGRYSDSDSVKYMIINDTLRRALGLASAEEAIGKQISLGGGPEFRGPIVGVVADFHQTSLHQPIAPIILTRNPGDYSMLAAKIDIIQQQEALAHLERIFEKAYPEDVFNYAFFDDTIAEFYEEQARQSLLFKVFSFISIFIGCLGLYGLVAFMAAQRTKEVGIRKVLGASILDITMLFSKEFVKLVLIAFLLAVPLSYYIMDFWLSDFTYKISISYGVFLLAGFITIAIALLTMSSKAIQAATANPVLSLKNE